MRFVAEYVRNNCDFPPFKSYGSDNEEEGPSDRSFKLLSISWAKVLGPEIQNDIEREGKREQRKDRRIGV